VRLWRLLLRLLNQASASFQHLPAAGAPTMALVALVRNSRTALRPVAALLLCLWIVAWATVAYLHAGRGPGGGRFDPTPIAAHHRLLPRFTAQLPPDAAVTATAAVHPHVSHRRAVYQFPIGVTPPGVADWALLDVTTATDMAPGDVRATVEAMLAGEWGVVDGADGFLLLHKGAPDKQIPPAFYDFARTPGITDRLAGAPALTLETVGVDDWPRWRATRILSTWRVGGGFDPAEMTPALELRTPSGETLAQADAALTPAWVWYPPDRWQPGDQVRLTTLPFYLPRVFGVVARQTPGLEILPDGIQGGGVHLTAAYARTSQGELAALPIAPTRAAAWPLAQPSLDLRPARFDLGDAQTLTLVVEPDAVKLWPGGTLDVRLLWDEADWPAGVQAFVHLRHDGLTVAQQDGLPRYFVQVDPADVPHAQGVDWRQLLAPETLPPGEWQVVVGLYDPMTGRRLPVIDGDGTRLGDEVVGAHLLPQAAPVPDQTCALIPESCASQPRE
jgi:hypothetical protein